MKALRFSVMALFFLLLGLPLFQRLTQVFPKRNITNVTIVREKPAFSLGRFLSGTYQTELSSWFMKNCGLWGALVTTENSLNYRVFRQVSSSYKSALVMGNNWVLFQRTYIDDFNGTNSVSDNSLEALAKKIRILQKYIESRGKSFLVLISPSKLRMHEEIVPSEFKIGAPKLRNYDRLRQFLAKEGVNFLSVREHLQSISNDQSQYFGFASSASHWNSLTNCYVVAELEKRINAVMNRPAAQINCNGQLVERSPRENDRDLVSMLNVWNAQPSLKPTRYLAVSGSFAGAYRPNILFVGTSFLWAVQQLMEKLGLYTNKDMYFYYRTNHFFHTDSAGVKRIGKRSIDKAKLDWEKNVFSHDAVVMEISEAKISELGHGFIEQALEHIPH